MHIWTHCVNFHIIKSVHSHFQIGVSQFYRKYESVINRVYIIHDRTCYANKMQPLHLTMQRQIFIHKRNAFRFVSEAYSYTRINPTIEHSKLQITKRRYNTKTQSRKWFSYYLHILCCGINRNRNYFASKSML